MDHETGPWVWTMRLDCETGPWDWTVRLDREIGPWDWTMRLDHLTGLWEWTMRLECETWSWYWNFRLDIETGPWAWTVRLDRGTETWDWIVRLYPLWHYRLWSFKSRDTKLKIFLHKNQHTQRKLLNFANWTNGEPQYIRILQKSKFLKLIISFIHYFWCQNWDQWHKMSGKNTHIYFFKRVWAENIGKKTKKFQKRKSCRQLS